MYDENSNADLYRFDPDFQFGRNLISYPRNNRAPVLGNNSFDPTSETLSIKSLHSPEDNSGNYAITLKPSSETPTEFFITKIDTVHPSSSWQHQSAFSLKKCCYIFQI
jgi:hypothetical protein|tara:strand:+ start:321 stop:644 length:324 start_codon:yes stop_codon:yes gene_type:complete